MKKSVKYLLDIVKAKGYELDYYELGYADGEADCKNDDWYDNSLFDEKEYIRGYEDGWNYEEAKERVEDEDEEDE